MDFRVPGIDKPHDHFFKWAFSQHENARDLLRATLPSRLVAELDLDQLASAPTSAVDDLLSEHLADLVYRIPWRDLDEHLYAILEHKSWPAPWALFDVVAYSVDIVRAYRKKHRTAAGPPLVIPVIVHHGVDGWTAPTSLRESYNIPANARDALGARAIAIEPVIYDVATKTEDDLRQRGMNPLATLVLWTLANARKSDDILEKLVRVSNLVRAVFHRPQGRRDLATISGYIMDVCEIVPEDFKDQLMTILGPAANEVYMTAGQILRHEGRLEGCRHQLLMQIEYRFGNVPDQVAQQVHGADMGQLDAWAKAVLVARNLQEIFGDES